MPVQPVLLAGYILGGAPYGIYLDEMDDDYLTGMITQADLANYRTRMDPVREYRHRTVLASRHESACLQDMQRIAL